MMTVLEHVKKKIKKLLEKWSFQGHSAATPSAGSFFFSFLTFRSGTFPTEEEESEFQFGFGLSTPFLLEVVDNDRTTSWKKKSP